MKVDEFVDDLRDEIANCLSPLHAFFDTPGVMDHHSHLVEVAVALLDRAEAGIEQAVSEFNPDIPVVLLERKPAPDVGFNIYSNG